ncbi:MAG TPA: MlaD family protein [Verrucomicrobiae bacterium]|jgi:phospholipid/cholesterol/gamma-HCH transport system substrate-binding protein
MNDSRIALKVGIFAAIGLGLMAVLVLSFSRGLTLFSSTYKLRIVLPSAAGLKPTADVMMSGVPIGKASGVELAADGRSVIVSVSILSKYQVRTNALIHIDALGFLGDQYIEVTPSFDESAPYWRDGAVVQGESPMNMQAAVKSVSGLLDQARTTIAGINYAVCNLNRTVLSGQSLNDFTHGLSNMEIMVANVRQVSKAAEELIQSNSPNVNTAVSNLANLSVKLNVMADDLHALVTTNGPVVDAMVQNLRDTSASFKQVSADLEAGKGLAGGLLKDPEMKAEVQALLSNASVLSASFAAFGSNLNQRGIWSMMWKPKHTERNTSSPR